MVVAHLYAICHLVSLKEIVPMHNKSKIKDLLSMLYQAMRRNESLLKYFVGKTSFAGLSRIPISGQLDILFSKTRSHGPQVVRSRRNLFPVGSDAWQNAESFSTMASSLGTTQLLVFEISHSAVKIKRMAPSLSPPE